MSYRIDSSTNKIYLFNNDKIFIIDILQQIEEKYYVINSEYGKKVVNRLQLEKFAERFMNLVKMPIRK